MEGSALLAAIIAAPDDDEPRLVYADWLSQKGDPLGELMALQVRRARALADDIALPERRRIEKRIRTLLDAHGEAWKAPLVAIAKATYTFRRGFVEHLENYADRNLGFVAGELFAHAPLLRAARVKADQLHAILMNEASARFEELELVGPSLDTQMLARLAERLDGGALRRIDLEAPYIVDGAGLDLLATSFAVEHVGIAKPSGIGRVTGSFVQRLANAPGRDRLRSLRLVGVGLSRVEALPPLYELTTLEVDDCDLGRQRGNLLALVRANPWLTSLSIARDKVSVDELADVVAACHDMRRARMRHLDLRGADVLVPWAPTLRRLDLAGNAIDDSAAKRIIDTDWPHLIELRIRQHALSEPVKGALAERFRGVLA